MQFFSCLAAAAFVHAAVTLLIVEKAGSDNALLQQSKHIKAKRPERQSRYVKSNQFMLKDAVCNFTNGELVCHRTVGLRHISRLTGS